MQSLEDKSSLFVGIMERIRYNRKKKQLKAALRRKPKPSKVIIKDEDIPDNNERSLNDKTTPDTPEST
jgi:hypothetical protein